MGGMLAFLAEASPTIGTGHVVETATLVREAEARGLASAVWVNAATPPGLLEKLPPDVRRIAAYDTPALGAVATDIRALATVAIVTNLRAIRNEELDALRAAGAPIVCIDEWGNRALDCDAVVNPSPVPGQHRYTSSHSGFALHTGLAYLPLGSEYRARVARKHGGPLRSIVVAMGG